MYYYSNNYSKYIEQLKLEKSKIAFRQMIEDSKEDKSPDVKIQDVFPAKESESVTKEFGLPDKDRQPVSYEGNILRKSGSKIDTENINSSVKSENNLGVVDTDSVRYSTDISAENSFSEIEPNNLNIDKTFNIKSELDLKYDNGNDVRSESDISKESDYSGKKSDELEFGITDESKNEKVLSNTGSFAEKAETNLSNNQGNSVKSGRSLANNNDVISKEEKTLSASYAASTKSTIDIIKEIQEEKKSEGEFADVISEPKKHEVTNLNRQYQYFIINPKDYENHWYEHNANKGINGEQGYYPAGSYDIIDAKQTNALESVVSTISNDNSWDGAGNTVVSSLKVANDLIDMINLVGPSTNIYVPGKTANKLRWDLKVTDEYTENTKPKNDSISPNDMIVAYSHDVNGEEVTTKQVYENIATETRRKTEKEILDTNKEGTYDIAVSKKDELVKVRGKNYENDNEFEFAKGEDFPSKDNEKKEIDELNDIENFNSTRAAYYIRHNTNDGIDNEFTGNENFSNKDDEKRDLKFKYHKNNEVENIAEISIPDSRWYDSENYIGKIYVMPPYEEISSKEETGAGNNNRVNMAFSIPLQNNLTFEQTSRAATWNAINFFGRIGDVQQYSKTTNLDAITLTTKYFVDNDDRKTGDISGFTMSRLQNIEMMYRSLVLPASDTAKYLYANDNDDNGYYYFTRPPIINIVLGNRTNNNTNPDAGDVTKDGPYHNLFTEIYSINPREGGSNIFYKNFVVTNVAIDKNLNDYNYYVDGNKYYDTTGFTVTLTVLEIDENYLGSLPSFNNYYNTLKYRNAF